MSGLPFEGFSGAILVDIETIGASGPNSVILKSVGNSQNGGMNFGSFLGSDTMGPTVSLSSQMSNTNAVFGSVITLPSAAAYDVLQYRSNPVALTVKDGNNNVVYNGVAHGQKDITLATYGSYEITYTATDALGRNTVNIYMVRVLALSPPVVTFAAEIPSKVTMDSVTGYDWTVPDYTVDCPSDANPVVTLMICRSDGTTAVLRKGEQFKFHLTGVHTLIVHIRYQSDFIEIVFYDITSSL